MFEQAVFRSFYVVHILLKFYYESVQMIECMKI